jgi:pimeloyl-ACP methyl ester carboxylesterase
MRLHRRQFLKASLTAASAVALRAQPPMNALKSIKTKVLDVAYLESGPADGQAVILLHGFPDDAYAYELVAPPLAQTGYRVLVPWIRGYGGTRFLDPAAPRMAEQAAIGQDVIDFADALRLNRFAVGGFDWGGRAAGVAAALHPERITHALLVGGYTIQNVFSPGTGGSPEGIARAWYQWYFNAENGRAGLTKNRKALCKYMWQTWSPTWKFSDAMYDKSAASFENPDFVDCVIHSYRHRNGNAPGEPRFDADEHVLAKRPRITCPVLTLFGGDDPFGRTGAEATAAEKESFPKLVGHRIVDGAGHFVPHEKPEAVAAALLELLKVSA